MPPAMAAMSLGEKRVAIGRHEGAIALGEQIAHVHNCLRATGKDATNADRLAQQNAQVSVARCRSVWIYGGDGVWSLPAIGSPPVGADFLQAALRGYGHSWGIRGEEQRAIAQCSSPLMRCLNGNKDSSAIGPPMRLRLQSQGRAGQLRRREKP